MKHYDEKRVAIELARKGVTADFVNKRVVTNNIQIGIHTWGKIDFLVNHCGYSYSKDSVSEIKTKKEETSITEYNVIKKKAKAENNNLIKSGVMKATKFMKKLIKQ